MGLKLIMNRAALEASIEQAGARAVKGMVDKMRKRAIAIRDLARRYAPIDHGNLESAIDYMSLRNPQTRRLDFIIFVDPDVAARGDPDDPNKVTGDYALLVHEYMAPYGTGSLEGRPFHASPKSLAKGPGVGGKYLQRAFQRGARGLKEECAGEVRRVLLVGAAPRLNSRNSMMDLPGDDE